MTHSPNQVHSAVRNHYAKQAQQATDCCASNPSSACCDSKKLLYPEELLSTLPTEIASFSLGCGDPITLADLQAGQTVLDLGSGGGLDCFLASKKVGENGSVIGVDMTPEMVERARTSAERLGYKNVEFRQGFLEQLPVEDGSIEVVLSNCVINLTPDKPQVFREIFRVLKPGGKIAVSDIVSNGPLPAALRENIQAWGKCLGGALDVKEYTLGLIESGFTEIKIQPRSDLGRLANALPVGTPFSATITARKPL
jgi:arsenite methyltransferase